MTEIVNSALRQITKFPDCLLTNQDQQQLDTTRYQSVFANTRYLMLALFVHYDDHENRLSLYKNNITHFSIVFH
jgi:hypothetical protein